MAVLNPRQVTAMTGVPGDTLKYWRWLGPDGPGPDWFKIASRVAYDEEVVEDWLEAARRKTGSEARRADRQQVEARPVRQRRSRSAA